MKKMKLTEKQKEILKKVEEIATNRLYKQSCIEEGICSKCGGELKPHQCTIKEKYITGILPFIHSERYMICPICDTDKIKEIEDRNKRLGEEYEKELEEYEKEINLKVETIKTLFIIASGIGHMRLIC